MKRYFCDYCEKEMPRPWMKIRVENDLSSLRVHYCRKCAERFLAAIQEMEETKEEEK